MNSPVQIIDGRADNAPYRASMLMLFVAPIIIYPALLLFLSIQTAFNRFIKATSLQSHILTSIVSNAVISAIIANGLYAPQFGETFLKTWLVSYPVVLLLILLMILTWWFVREKECLPQKKTE